MVIYTNFINTDLGDENSFFTPFSLAPTADKLIEVSFAWVKGLGQYRRECGLLHYDKGKMPNYFLLIATLSEAINLSIYCLMTVYENHVAIKPVIPAFSWPESIVIIAAHFDIGSVFDGYRPTPA